MKSALAIALLAIAMPALAAAPKAATKSTDEANALKACGKDKACKARASLFFAGGIAPVPTVATPALAPSRVAAKSLVAGQSDVTLAAGESITISAAPSGGGPTPPVPPSPVPPSPVPPNPTDIQCTGFNKTLVLPMDWVNPQRMFTSQWGGFGVNDAVVVKFTTGSVDSPSNNLPKIGGAEYGSTPTARYAVLSAKPCDWDAQQWAGASASGYSVTVPFAVGNGGNFGYYPKLDKLTTYYFNIKNLQGAGCAATGGCDMFVDLGKSF